MSASWKQLCVHAALLLASCRHVDTKTSGPTSTPMSPISTAVRSVVLKGENHTEWVELLEPVELALECSWTGKVSQTPNITGHWRKDGEEVDNSRLTVPLENDKYHLRRAFRIDSEEKLGTYSCVFGNEARVDFVLSGPQIGAVRDKPVVSYVGDDAVVVCKLEETKPRPVSWNWYKANGTNREQVLVAAEPRRYEIVNKERQTRLLVFNLTQADSGLYYCKAVYGISTTTGHVELRVITLWEPLKTFIGILAEVIVLVAAILLYERSRSGKQRKGDAAANAEQAMTLTQGESNQQEESSSARQRKV